MRATLVVAEPEQDAEFHATPPRCRQISSFDRFSRVAVTLPLRVAAAHYALSYRLLIFTPRLFSPDSMMLLTPLRYAATRHAALCHVFF